MPHLISVRLLCRNSIVREGLSRILSDCEFDVVQSSSTLAALRSTDVRDRASGPSLLVIDNGAEECDVENLTALKAHFPDSHLVMLSDQFDFPIMLKAFQLGVRAYIVKEISCDRLVATLRLVAMGERVLPSQLADELQLRPGLASAPGPENTVADPRLSGRELEILRWLIMGCPNKVISRRMDISEATVKVHVKGVLRKLKVTNRTQAAIWAANHGMSSRCHEVEEETFDRLPHPSEFSEPAEARLLLSAA